MFLKSCTKNTTQSTKKNYFKQQTSSPSLKRFEEVKKALVIVIEQKHLKSAGKSGPQDRLRGPFLTEDKKIM